MKNFFEWFFGPQAINTQTQQLGGTGVGGAEGSTASPGLSRLSAGLQSGGGQVLRTVVIIAVFASVIMLTIAFIMYFVSTRGPTRDQSKQRIVRTLVSIALIALAGTLVTSIFFGIFNGPYFNK